MNVPCPIPSFYITLPASAYNGNAAMCVCHVCAAGCVRYMPQALSGESVRDNADGIPRQN